MTVRRIRGPHPERGFAVVEMVVAATIMVLVAGLLVDLVIVSLRHPRATSSALAPGQSELVIARFVSKDVLHSVTAASQQTACGVFHAALVTTERSTSTLAKADQAVAYSVGPDGLSRSTCAPGAKLAATTTVVSSDVVVFSSACQGPGACGTVHVEVQTATPDSSSTHPFSLDITRQ